MGHLCRSTRRRGGPRTSSMSCSSRCVDVLGRCCHDRLHHLRRDQAWPWSSPPLWRSWLSFAIQSFVVRRSSFVVRRCVVRRSSFGRSVVQSSFVVRRSSFVVRSSSFVVRRSSFVVVRLCVCLATALRLPILYYCTLPTIPIAALPTTAVVGSKNAFSYRIEIKCTVYGFRKFFSWFQPFNQCSPIPTNEGTKERTNERTTKVVLFRKA